jgi:hypothetical protein
VAGWALAYLAVQFVSLSMTFFVRNSLEISRSSYAFDVESNSLTLSNGQSCVVEFDEANAKVKDCYRYERKERFDICRFISEEWSLSGLPHRRSVQSLEAELAIHSIAYRLGVETESSKNADLGLEEDGRWYVAASCRLAETIGL